MRSPTITVIGTLPQNTAPNNLAGGDIAAIVWARDWNPPIVAAMTRAVESLTVIGVGFRDEYPIESTSRELVYARI